MIRGTGEENKRSVFKWQTMRNHLVTEAATIQGQRLSKCFSRPSLLKKQKRKENYEAPNVLKIWKLQLLNIVRNSTLPEFEICFLSHGQRLLHFWVMGNDTIFWTSNKLLSKWNRKRWTWRKILELRYVTLCHSIVIIYVILHGRHVRQSCDSVQTSSKTRGTEMSVGWCQFNRNTVLT